MFNNQTACLCVRVRFVVDSRNHYTVLRSRHRPAQSFRGSRRLKRLWKLHVILELKITSASFEDEVSVFFRSGSNSLTVHTLPTSRMVGNVRANVTLKCIWIFQSWTLTTQTTMPVNPLRSPFLVLFTLFARIVKCSYVYWGLLFYFFCSICVYTYVDCAKFRGRT